MDDLLTFDKDGQHWTATPHLRWKKSTIMISDHDCEETMILEQLWKSHTGKQKWREIETVEYNGRHTTLR